MLLGHNDERNAKARRVDDLQTQSDDALRRTLEAERLVRAVRATVAALQR